MTQDSTATATPTLSLRERSQALLERLVQTYPATFFPPDERRIKPLKLRIHKDLAPVVKEWGFETAVLRYTLAGYTRRLRYQMALLKVPQRVDLQGEPAGEISAEHRQIAQERVALLREKRRSNPPRPGRPTKRQPPKPDGISPEAVAALQKKLSRKATL